MGTAGPARLAGWAAQSCRKSHFTSHGEEPGRGSGKEVTGLGLEHSCEEEERVWEGLEGGGDSSGIGEVLRKGREVAASFPFSNFKDCFQDFRKLSLF